MYCHDICGTLFPLLHKICEVPEILIMCNGLGIYCIAMFTHFHNFAITVNMCTLADNSALSKLPAL